MGELKQVEIRVAGKTIPLRVTEEEASWITSLESEINGKIQEFQSSYAHLDKTDSIIMTLLTYAFENKQKLSSLPKADDSVVEEKLDELLQVLSAS